MLRAQFGLRRAGAELKKMCEEDEGLDVIVTVVLLSIGLIVAGVLAKYATRIINSAGQQVDRVTNTGYTGGGMAGGGSGGGGGGTFGGGGGGQVW